MYRLEIKPALESEATTEEYNFVVKDLVVSISDRLSIEEDMITNEGNSLVFDCESSEKDIKNKLKDVFTYHFDILRFVEIKKF